tara:strand:+ start:11034 stop:11720 length:687 start_codon:yes stop_codon:yes gene_type:complete
MKSLLMLSAFVATTYAHVDEKEVVAEKKDRSHIADRTYISGGLVLNEFRSVSVPFEESGKPDFVLGDNFPLTGQTYALSFTYGTYITENFKTEIRYSTGIIEDTLDELLDVNINYSFNWYIGGTLPVTDYLNTYALVGVSFYDADVTRREIRRPVQGEFGPQEQTIRPSSTDIDEDLFGTKFSMSWILGIDYELNERWFLAFEYGRLLKDTDTNIKVYQAGTHLRYEF